MNHLFESLIPTPPKPVPRPKEILLIEDDRSILSVMKSVLELEGYAVTTACDGAQGSRALQTSFPDVILLDMMMPVANGWDFLDTLRADARTSSIPVVVVSAYEEIGRSVHPTAFVPKPVQLKTLLSAVQKCVA